MPSASFSRNIYNSIFGPLIIAARVATARKTREIRLNCSFTFNWSNNILLVRRFLFAFKCEPNWRRLDYISSEIHLAFTTPYSTKEHNNQFHITYCKHMFQTKRLKCTECAEVIDTRFMRAQNIAMSFIHACCQLRMRMRLRNSLIFLWCCSRFFAVFLPHTHLVSLSSIECAVANPYE